MAPQYLRLGCNCVEGYHPGHLSPSPPNIKLLHDTGCGFSLGNSKCECFIIYIKSILMASISKFMHVVCLLQLVRDMLAVLRIYLWYFRLLLTI